VSFGTSANERQGGAHVSAPQIGNDMTRGPDHYASKVPEVTLGFWIIKILATTLGETGGDTVTMTMDLGYLAGTAIFLSALVVLVGIQIAAKKWPSNERFRPSVAASTAPLRDRGWQSDGAIRFGSVVDQSGTARTILLGCAHNWVTDISSCVHGVVTASVYLMQRDKRGVPRPLKMAAATALANQVKP
jgi:hypothetical protein